MRIRQTSEYQKWAKKLRDRSAKARIEAHLRAWQHSGELFGDIKSVGGNVSELRFHFGAGYRVYFTAHGNEIVLLLIGGDKSTQRDDIEKAHRILNLIKEEQ